MPDFDGITLTLWIRNAAVRGVITWLALSIKLTKSFIVILGDGPRKGVLDRVNNGKLPQPVLGLVR